jgi:hypothetical protein
MNRKLRFKQQRIYRLKILLVSLVFIGVLLFGLVAVDISKNYMLYGKHHIELLQIKSSENDIYNLSVLNAKFNINLKYLKRDLNNIKIIFSKIIGN